MTNVIDIITDRRRETVAKAEAAFRELALKVANNDEVDPDEADAVLADADRGVHDLAAAVARIDKRRRLAAVLNSMPARRAEAARVAAAEAALDAEVEQAMRAFRLRRAEIHSQAAEAANAVAEAAAAEAEMAKTHDPELVAQAESVRRMIASYGRPAAELRERIANRLNGGPNAVEALYETPSERQAKAVKHAKEVETNPGMVLLRKRLADAEAEAAPKVAEATRRLLEIEAKMRWID